MLLSRRILLGNLLLLTVVLALAVASIVGLLHVRRKVNVAVYEYRELRLIKRAALHLAVATTLMPDATPDASAITQELRSAIQTLETYIGEQPQLVAGSASHEWLERSLGTNAIESVKRVLATYTASDQKPTPQQLVTDLKLLHESTRKLETLIADADALIAETHRMAARDVRNTILVISALGCMVVAVGVMIAVRQYERIVRPLSRLRHAVRTVASGGLSTRVLETGDTEFRELATDFNRMAKELDTLYASLEEKVALKSRELVQSERLASVGFLAAGVAHEINNPLNIISGYSELSHRRLTRDSDPQAIKDTLETLQIVRDEAFRCKQITEKLLSLATPSEGSHEPLLVRRAAEDVLTVLQHHKHYRDRKFTLQVDESAELMVSANENEIKQVLLNLMMNAIEATDPNMGKVWIAISRNQQWIRVAVNDNGKGMTQEVCQRVFEPFFSAKRRDAGRGVGLGLSISHAIVASHFGRLSAHSEGLGRGSSFVMELPSYSNGVRA
jgi:signal transduction histidine kinase